VLGGSLLPIAMPGRSGPVATGGAPVAAAGMVACGGSASTSASADAGAVAGLGAVAAAGAGAGAGVVAAPGAGAVAGAVCAKRLTGTTVMALAASSATRLAFGMSRAFKRRRPKRAATVSHGGGKSVKGRV
jgi:hypothetical protein